MSKEKMHRCEASVVVILALTLGFGAAGCAAQASEPIPQVSQDAFLARLDAVCEQGGYVPLRDLTDVEWDRVSLFPEGTPPSEYKAETGADAPHWGIFGSRTPDLMVLQKDGEVVQMTQFAPQVLWWNKETLARSYDADVMVKMSETDSFCRGELVPAAQE